MGSTAELIQIVDRAVAQAMKIAGPAIRCRRGCQHCCIGPFLVTSLDLELLRTGLHLLEPEDSARIQDRAAEARQAMQSGFPGNWQTGELEAENDPFDDRHKGLPCPVLDLETGVCSLYEHRPIACRLHGAAITINDQKLNHCRLNHVGQSAAEIDQQRVGIQTPPDPPPNFLTYICSSRKSRSC